MKKCIIVLLAALLAFSLCACGGGTFTVDHIEFMYDYSSSGSYNLETISSDEQSDGQSILKYDPYPINDTTHNYNLVGQYNGEEIKIDIDKLSDSFKDCTVTDYICNETDENGNVGYEVLSEEKLRLYKTCKLKGGMTLTLEDKDGNTHKVVVDNGTQFKAEGSGKETKLLLPEEN